MRPVLYPEAEQYLLFLKSRKGFDEEVLDRLSKYKRISFTVIITNSFFTIGLKRQIDAEERGRKEN